MCKTILTSNNDIACLYTGRPCECNEKFDPKNLACSKTVEMFNDSIEQSLHYIDCGYPGYKIKNELEKKMRRIKYLEGMGKGSILSSMTDYWIKKVNEGYFEEKSERENNEQ